MVEKNPGVHEFFDGSAPVIRQEIEVPGLKAGNHRSVSNYTELPEEKRRIFSEKPWYRILLSDVRKHKKSAIFVTTFGGVIIFVAGVAGFEFGVRDGRDLRILPKLLKRKKNK